MSLSLAERVLKLKRNDSPSSPRMLQCKHIVTEECLRMHVATTYYSKHVLVALDRIDRRILIDYINQHFARLARYVHMQRRFIIFYKPKK